MSKPKRFRKGRQYASGDFDHEEYLIHHVEIGDDGRLKVEVRLVVTLGDKCWNDVVNVVLDPED